MKTLADTVGLVDRSCMTLHLRQEYIVMFAPKNATLDPDIHAAVGRNAQHDFFGALDV